MNADADVDAGPLNTPVAFQRRKEKRVNAVYTATKQNLKKQRRAERVALVVYSILMCTATAAALVQQLKATSFS